MIPKITQKSQFDSSYITFFREKFEIDCHSVNCKSPPDYQSDISYDLEDAVMRQRDFYYNVSLPHFKDSSFLTGAINRYKKFISLKKINR